MTVRSSGGDDCICSGSGSGIMSAAIFILVSRTVAVIVVAVEGLERAALGIRVIEMARQTLPKITKRPIVRSRLNVATIVVSPTLFWV